MAACLAATILFSAYKLGNLQRLLFRRNGGLSFFSSSLAQLESKPFLTLPELVRGAFACHGGCRTSNLYGRRR